MKKALLLLILGLGIPAHASQEWHTFTSADGKRTFKGQLVAFDGGAETVTVFNEKRQRISFKMDLISEDDQDYVTENAEKLPPEANLEIRFEDLNERKDYKRGTDTKTKTYDGGYQIFVSSYTPLTLEKAEVEYVMIYRKDQVDGNYSDGTVKGSKTVDIPSNSFASIQTETVDLVNFYKAGKVTSSGGGGGGGCSGGGCSRGAGGISVTVTKSERSRDYLIGCVARVSVNGHVVCVNATSPAILAKYESELDSGK